MRRRGIDTSREEVNLDVEMRRGGVLLLERGVEVVRMVLRMDLDYCFRDFWRGSLLSS